MIPYFFKTPQFLKELYPHAIWSVDSKEKSIYLTFDDGPDPVATPLVLDILKRFEAKATFFCIGEKVVKNQEVFEEVLSEGHTIGNHTFSHLDGWRTNAKDYISNWQKCDQIIYENQSWRLFRPPYGRIKSNQYREIAKRDQVVFWSHLSGDFDLHLNCDSSIQSLIKAAPGSILLFHDSIQSIENFKRILPKVLDHFTILGFKFKTLDPNEIN